MTNSEKAKLAQYFAVDSIRVYGSNDLSRAILIKNNAEEIEYEDIMKLARELDKPTFHR